MTHYETIASRVTVGQYFYPNAFGRHFLLTLEEVLGPNGAKALLNLAAGLPQFIDHYPPDDLKREFDIVHFAAVNAGLDEMGRKFMHHYRTGWQMGQSGLMWYPGMADFEDEAFKILPLDAKLKVAVPKLAAVLCEHDRQGGTLHSDDHAFYFSQDICPCCYGRKAEDYQTVIKSLRDKPICYTFKGLLEGGLFRLTGENFKVTETQCVAHGHEKCVFQILKTPLPK